MDFLLKLRETQTHDEPREMLSTSTHINTVQSAGWLIVREEFRHLLPEMNLIRFKMGSGSTGEILTASQGQKGKNKETKVKKWQNDWQTHKKLSMLDGNT